MADNYLEQRMDDMRNGRLRPAPVRQSTVGCPATPRILQKGYIRFPMPPRRVLVVGGTIEPWLSVARAFRKADCRVAVCGNDTAAGEGLARNEGMRYIPGEPDMKSSLRVAFDNIINAWRDVDVIVAPVEAALILSQLWTRHKERFPISSDYGGRMIVLSRISHDNISSAEEFSSPDGIDFTENVYDALATHKITVNFISAENEKAGEAAASLALFLATPLSASISRSTVIIT